MGKAANNHGKMKLPETKGKAKASPTPKTRGDAKKGATPKTRGS